MTESMKASENASKIRELMEAGKGFAHLYRTAVGGPSGQRQDILVGRIRYFEFGKYEFGIYDPGTGEVAGYAYRTPFGEWSIDSYNEFDGYRWMGYASSLSVGCDVLLHGEHAALGRHDSRRISSGSIRKGHEDPNRRTA